MGSPICIKPHGFLCIRIQKKNMKKISAMQVGLYMEDHLKYSMKPHKDGYVLSRYESLFNRIFGIKMDEFLVELPFGKDIPKIPSLSPDSNVDFHSYTKYCEKGFSENPMEDDMLDLLNAVTGVAEEANELMGVVRKFVFHNKPFSVSDFASEAGDMTWFFANTLRIVGIKLTDVFRANKIKLDFRYPSGRAKNYKLNNRNKDEEKKLVKKLLMESGAYDTYNKITNNHAN